MSPKVTVNVNSKRTFLPGLSVTSRPLFAFLSFSPSLFSSSNFLGLKHLLTDRAVLCSYAACISNSLVLCIRVDLKESLLYLTLVTC